MRHTSLTPDEELNSLIYETFFYVNIYGSYKLFKTTYVALRSTAQSHPALLIRFILSTRALHKIVLYCIVLYCPVFWPTLYICNK